MPGSFVSSTKSDFELGERARQRAERDICELWRSCNHFPWSLHRSLLLLQLHLRPVPLASEWRVGLGGPCLGAPAAAARRPASSAAQNHGRGRGAGGGRGVRVALATRAVARAPRADTRVIRRRGPGIRRTAGLRLRLGQCARGAAVPWTCVAAAGRAALRHVHLRGAR